MSNHNSGEAQELPLSFVKSVKAYKYKEAITALKKEVSKDDEHIIQLALELAVEKNAEPVVEYILRKCQAEDYSVLGLAKMEVFSLLERAKLEKLPEELVIPIYVKALTSNLAEKKLALLKQWGLPLDLENEDGETLIQLLEKESCDLRVLRSLKEMESKGTLHGNIKKKRMISLLVYVLVFVLIAAICYAVGQELGKSSMDKLQDELGTGSMLKISTESQ